MARLQDPLGRQARRKRPSMHQIMAAAISIHESSDLLNEMLAIDFLLLSSIGIKSSFHLCLDFLP